MRILAFVLAILVLASVAGASEPDHLLPTDRSYDRAYFGLLNRKLANTPFDYGRIIVRPPFTGEYSISIYRETTPNGASRYHITMKAAEESLWQASSGGVDPTKAEGIKIREADVSITPELARVLRDALAAMVDQTRPLGNEEKPARIVIEGPLTELMVLRDGKVATGQMGNFPPTTPKLKLLDKLIANLKGLCESPPSERTHLLAEVTSTAEALRNEIASGR
jgi:hypothetical protein